MKSGQRLALAIAGVALVVDQATKAWAIERLTIVGASLRLPGPVDLTLGLNYSNAFSLAPVWGEVTRWGLVSANIAVALGIFVVIVRARLQKITCCGLALVMAGTIGNAVDRIRLGAVIDFIDASKLGFVWVFNVADASLDFGRVLLVLSARLIRKASLA